MNRHHRLQRFAEKAIAEQAIAHGLKMSGRFPFLADDPDCPDVMRLAALMEELGEVARCVHDGDRDGLRLELAQLAGIAIAWGSAEDTR